jgi:integrase/recombinase XerD
MSTSLTTTGAQIPSQASTDTQLLALWLHGRPESTVHAYSRDVSALLEHAGKPLREITLADLQSFADTLAGEPSSRKRTLSAVKSVFTFAHRLGFIPFNVGAALSLPKVEQRLAERILTESEVHAMIALTPRQRDALLLKLLYASAARVSELSALTWRNVQPAGEAGQVTLYGKGGKTRAVRLSPALWAELSAWRNGAAAGEPVFASQKGGALDESQVHRIVRAAARRAGIAGNVSPHFLRHSHASHALQRGASLALVRDTLGHASASTTNAYLHAKPSESSSLYLSV